MDSTPTTTPQQFCLRWHNHQTSLLSSLPLLLDQSHLTDVTLSAEGRTVRAHRVVLSACSTFFSELFRTLEPPFHPVVVLPGTSFSALVALLTFMYSGEVNVFEEQITTLLGLAETLGIKGLADFHGNITKSSPKSDTPSSTKDSISDQLPPSPLSSTTPTHPLHQHHHPKVLTSPFENLFSKSFQFYPHLNLNQQPLNFSTTQSTTSSSKSRHNRQGDKNNNNSKLIGSLKDTKFNLNSNLISNNDDEIKKSNLQSPTTTTTTLVGSGTSENTLNFSKKLKFSDMRKIDKIAENLRCGNKMNHSNDLQMMLSSNSTSLMLKPSMHQQHQSLLSHHNFLAGNEEIQSNKSSPQNLFLDNSNNNPGNNLNLIPSNSDSTTNHDSLIEKTNKSSISNVNVTSLGLTPGSNTTKISNSKLYATCFICHKQLSNQYNLRVHLETHQNVRYACTVCTHVSRSKDALRKHVSYRHPGTPSPCDSETRRKRSKQNLLANQQIKQDLLLEQHNNQLQQMIQSGQVSQFNQLMAATMATTALASSANSIAKLNNSNYNNNNSTPTPPTLSPDLNSVKSEEN